ncbi:hypothetical protein Taro_004333 [Colocasia esculenta]|uniref:Transposase n=1 Tax=Colocasia esculenta TaxID=4460 RepID=A0A843TLR5_COLES|nr:hypothetical protein [Colocasia esculenta]
MEFNLSHKQAEFVCKFLKPFFNATNVLSASKTPSSNMCLHEICSIRSLLHQEVDSSYHIIREMVPQMQVKFDKYWGDCTILYVITTVLDPHFKMLFLHYAFKQIYGLQCASFVSEVIEAIHVIFIEYKEQYNQNIQGDAPCDEEILANNEFLSGYNQFLSQQNLQESKSKLERYLDESVVPLSQKSFDILKWWSDNSLVYPTLFKIACDYLAIPASTVASEAAFSNGGRVLDQYRSRLTPDIVEALICCEDWLREEDHKQGDGERKKMEVACDANSQLSTEEKQLFS